MTNKLGSEIRRIRTEKGLDQESLAAHLDVSRVAVSLYESGKRTVPPEAIRAISTHLECDPIGLLEASIQDAISQTISKFKASR